MVRSNINWNDVPENLSLEAGYYIFQITSIKALEQTEKSPSYTFLGTFTVEEPAQYEGQMHFERFVVGTEKDPDAQEDASWKGLGMRNLRQLLTKAQAPLLESLEMTFEQAKGCRFVGRIVKTAGKGANEGMEFSNMRGYFGINSPEALKVGQEQATAKSPSPSAAVLSNAPAEYVCTECGVKVARSAYGSHLMSHKQAPQAG